MKDSLTWTFFDMDIKRNGLKKGTATVAIDKLLKRAVILVWVGRQDAIQGGAPVKGEVAGQAIVGLDLAFAAFLSRAPIIMIAAQTFQIEPLKDHPSSEITVEIEIH